MDEYPPGVEWPIVGRAALVEHVGELVLGRRRPVLLEGALGVGKTVVSGLVAQALRGEGWHVEVCVATAPEAAIPFGAFSRFLPPTLSGDLALTLEQAHRRVLGAAAGDPLLLLVDDVHHLDPGSLALLHRLVRSGELPVLLTYRAGETLDASVIALQQDGFLDRLAVPPLDRAAHDSLLAAALEGAPVARLADRLWEVTEGNPLFMRELVSQLLEQRVAASADGSLDEVSEVDLAPSPLLADIVQARVAGASSGAREALELVALAAPIRLDVLLRLSDRDDIAELEARRLVAVTDLGGQAHVIPDHPVYAETIRATLPPLQRLRLAGRLADALIADGLQEPGETLQAVRWVIEANEQPAPELALRAAAEALAKSDAALAERLVRSAGSPLATDALVVLGTALSVQGRATEARAALDEALALAASDPERAAAALALARHLVWMEQEFGAGTSVLAEAIEAVVDLAARAELRAELAICLTVAGDARATIRITDEVLAEPAASPRATLSVLVQSTLARTVLGLYDGLSTDLDRGEALAAELRAELPLALDQLGVTRAVWLHFVDLTAGAAVAAAGWRRATSEGGAAAILSNARALIEIDRGRLSSAVEAARRGLHEVQVFDPFRNEQVMLSTLSLALALRGESGEAERCASLAGPPESMEPRTRAYADRALVWRRAADRERAADLAIAGGARAVAGSLVTWGSLLYYDAVRLGRPELAVEPLARLAEETTAPLVDLMARHASAAVAQDAGELALSAGECLALGSPLFAAEAYAGAVACDPAEPARSRWLATAAHLASFCDGASTPPLAGLTSPLSGREIEVATLAAEGAANREIGEQLSLSVRTIENHLASVYRKLGLAGRDELPEVLPPVPF
jgi:DNA-binding CsgD family transcriptional regulator